MRYYIGNKPLNFSGPSYHVVLCRHQKLLKVRIKVLLHLQRTV